MIGKTLFTDVDTDGDTVEFEQMHEDGKDVPGMAYVSVNGDSGAYFHAPSLIEALVAHYGEPEPAKTLDDVKPEDVVDVEEFARYSAARMILDPSGLGVVSVAEVTLMADLLAKTE